MQLNGLCPLSLVDVSRTPGSRALWFGLCHIPQTERGRQGAREEAASPPHGTEESGVLPARPQVQTANPRRSRGPTLRVPALQRAWWPGNVAPPGILARIPNEELILICSMQEHFFRVRKSTLSWEFRLLQRCAIPHGRTGHFQACSLPPSLHLSVSPCLHLSLSLAPSLSLQRTASAWST